MGVTDSAKRTSPKRSKRLPSAPPRAAFGRRRKRRRERVVQKAEGKAKAKAEAASSSAPVAPPAFEVVASSNANEEPAAPECEVI